MCSMMVQRCAAPAGGWVVRRPADRQCKEFISPATLLATCRSRCLSVMICPRARSLVDQANVGCFHWCARVFYNQEEPRETVERANIVKHHLASIPSLLPYEAVSDNHLSVRPSNYLSVRPSVQLLVRPSVQLPVRPSIRPTTCASVRPTTLSVHPTPVLERVGLKQIIFSAHK